MLLWLLFCIFYCRQTRQRLNNLRAPPEPFLIIYRLGDDGAPPLECDTFTSQLSCARGDEYPRLLQGQYTLYTFALNTKTRC